MNSNRWQVVSRLVYCVDEWSQSKSKQMININVQLPINVPDLRPIFSIYFLSVLCARRYRAPKQLLAHIERMCVWSFYLIYLYYSITITYQLNDTKKRSVEY